MIVSSRGQTTALGAFRPDKRKGYHMSFRTIAIYVGVALLGAVLARKVSAVGDLLAKVGL